MERKVKYNYEFKLRCVEGVLKKNISMLILFQKKMILNTLILVPGLVFILDRVKKIYCRGKKTKSWRLKLGQIETTEMIEVQLVNSVAPFVLCNRLSEVMKKDNTGQKHIINVSAMEGKFHRFFKEARHPHTNMAKAALNMLTHTAAGELAKVGIFMNALDTGWVTDEDPAELAKRKQEIEDFQPPLDIVDGAARVMDPLFDGINTGKHWSGKFLKDYNPIPW